jgi:hypothetical protein
MAERTDLEYILKNYRKVYNQVRSCGVNGLKEGTLELRDILDNYKKISRVVKSVPNPGREGYTVRHLIDTFSRVEQKAKQIKSLGLCGATYSAITLAYITRVEADGGTVESPQCIDSKLNLT